MPRDGARRRLRGKPPPDAGILTDASGGGRITGLSPDGKRSGYVSVELDGSRLGIIPLEAVASLELQTGQALGESQLKALIEIVEFERTYTVAMNLLSGRSRSVNELLWRLRDRGHNPSAAARAVGRLETLGLLDDYQFSCNFARVKASKGNGRFRIVADLMGKGVDKEVAQKAVDEALAEDCVDPLEQVRSLAEKRVKQLGDISIQAKRRRLLGFLGRRGFRGYEVTDIVDGLVGVAEVEDP